MSWKRKKDEEFDAVHAAEELDEALGAQHALSPQEYIQELEAQVEGMSTLLNQKEALLARAQDRIREQDNEIERIKVRLKTEADQQVEKRVAEVIDELLDVGDDLGRAILSSQELGHEESVTQGLELVRQSFGKRLQKLGVTRMETKGQRFDPALHDAISMIPVHDPAQDGMILGVIREGYMLHGKPLREARVAVGKLSS